MSLCPTTYKSPAKPRFHPTSHNLINLLNYKQEIRHPRLFLSDNDDSVVLSDRLRPAPLIDFITYSEEAAVAPYFPRCISISPSAIQHQIHLPGTARASPYFLLPITPSIFYQRRRKCLYKEAIASKSIAYHHLVT
jgi:hypothetical protein